MKWNLAKRKIKELKNNQKNPRKLLKKDAEQLEKSLSKFGVCEPIVVNTDGTIIGGHQRVRILKKLGHKEVEVFEPETPLTEKDSDELNIRLNKNTGEFDFDVLANEWEVKDLIDWGFTEEELSFDIDVVDSSEEDNETPIEQPKDPKTNLGDVIELGDHRLLCGDSTNPDDVAKLLDGEEPILMVTDPPYGVNYDPDWRGKAGKGQVASGKVKNDDQVNWSLAYSLFPGSVAYVWCASWYLPEVSKNLDDNEFERKSLIIWVKQHFALSRGDYHWQHEPCWYAVRKGHKHNWQGSRKESTVWEVANLNAFGGKGKDEDDERTNHSTQKPIECMLKPIKNNSAKGEGVYDPFVGSGTTLIAAEISDRKSFCMELDPAYCDIVISRWVNHRKRKGKEADVIINKELIKWE